MKVVLENVWDTINAYARSSTNTVCGHHKEHVVTALVRADVVCGDAGRALANCGRTLDDSILHYMTLAYSSDCLRAMLAPFAGKANQRNYLSWSRCCCLLPAIKPIAEYYAANLADYAHFAFFADHELCAFGEAYLTGSGQFSFLNQDTKWSGLKACVYSSIVACDEGYYCGFANNVFVTLLDKAISAARNARRTREIRDQYTGVVNELVEQGRRYIAILKDTRSKVVIPVAGNNDVEHEEIEPQTKTGSPDVAFEEAQNELDEMIGVPSVKDEVRHLMNYLKIQEERRRHGLNAPAQSLHFIFKGNPGTGKTTIARILGKIFYGCGILKTAKFVECDRSSLVGGFLGQTAMKTEDVIKSALDGVLFIDEAYALTPKSEKYGAADMFGDEAINTLLKHMEDSRERLIVIAAGYPQLMDDFVRSNPGLESRFTRFINFPDYTAAELCRIFDSLCSKHQYKLTTRAYAFASMLFTIAQHRRDERFGNARFVRSVFEKTLALQSDRLAKLQMPLDKKLLTRIDEVDIPFENLIGIERDREALSQIKWEAQCPGCGNVSKKGVDFLGRRVSCACGVQFVYPWWNLVSEVQNEQGGVEDSR